MQVDGHGAFPSGIVAEAHLSLMMLLLRREGGRGRRGTREFIVLYIDEES